MKKEKFDYQGKRPEQLKDSYKIAGYTVGTGIFLLACFGVFKLGVWIYHLIF